MQQAHAPLGMEAHDNKTTGDECEGPNVDVLALHEALQKLEEADPRKAELVKLRYFAGMTNRQAAKTLGISASTADNDWAYAKSWLRVEMSKAASCQSDL